MSRIGKIARLPEQVREQVNCRLQDGENGREILAWLNSMDEVKTVLAQGFGGREITDSNLSDWRSGGYRDWEAQQFALAESRRVVEEGKGLGETGQGPLADHLSVWVIGQFMLATRRLREKADAGDDAGAWKMLRKLCHDVVALRRGDHGREWLRLEEERLKLQAKKQDSQREKLKEEIRRENPPREAMSEEEQEARWRQIFGMEPETHPLCKNANSFADDAENLETSFRPRMDTDEHGSDKEGINPICVNPCSTASGACGYCADSSVVNTPQEAEAAELRRITELAERGHPYSAYCLGGRYRDGLGVPKDLAKAREWLGKAASQGIGGAKIEMHALRMKYGDQEAGQKGEQIFPCDFIDLRDGVT